MSTGLLGLRVGPGAARRGAGIHFPIPPELLAQVSAEMAAALPWKASARRRRPRCSWARPCHAGLEVTIAIANWASRSERTT